MLEVADVTVAFGGPPVLDGVSLTVGPGEVVALLGASGSGKSTLLRVIAGLIVPDGGSVGIDGRDVTRVPTHRRSVGMVFQDEQLFPHLSVRDNVAFGLKMAGTATAARHARADELLTLVGLDGFGDRRIDRLSGGEAKRVAVARSLAPSPKVLLLDEPLTGLDRELHDRLLTDVAAIVRDASTTAVWVTHDVDEAGAVADRVERLTELGRAATHTSATGTDSNGTPSNGWTVVVLDPADTHPLRRSVLRDGTPTDDVVFDGDDLADTVHVGVRDADGRVVAISTWLGRDWPADPHDPPRRAVQLRGMATAPEVRGTGVGGLLLAAGVERAAATGAALVWARSRVTALDFYRRHGFETVGDEYVDATTGLPHRDVVRELVGWGAVSGATRAGRR